MPELCVDMECVEGRGLLTARITQDLGLRNPFLKGGDPMLSHPVHALLDVIIDKSP